MKHIFEILDVHMDVVVLVSKSDAQCRCLVEIRRSSSFVLARGACGFFS